MPHNDINQKIFEYNIQNTYRSVGTRLSHYIYKKFGDGKMNLDIININSLMGYLIFSPVAVIGVVMGHWMNSKLSDKSFFMVINFFIVIASLRLVYLGLMDL